LADVASSLTHPPPPQEISICKIVAPSVLMRSFLPDIPQALPATSPLDRSYSAPRNPLTLSPHRWRVIFMSPRCPRRCEDKGYSPIFHFIPFFSARWPYLKSERQVLPPAVLVFLLYHTESNPCVRRVPRLPGGGTVDPTTPISRPLTFVPTGPPPTVSKILLFHADGLLLFPNPCLQQKQPTSLFRPHFPSSDRGLFYD